MQKMKYWDDKSYFPLKTAVNLFVQGNDITKKLSEEDKKDFEEQLFSFLETIKEPLADEVRNEKFREEIALELECIYNDFGKELYEILPKEVLDDIVVEWRREIANRSNPRDFNGDIMRSILRSQNWCKRSYRHSEAEEKLYLLYLKEWYRLHVDSKPSTIDEFLNNEMTNGQIAPKYWNLLKEQESPRRLSKDDKAKIKKIVDRAEILRLLFFDRELATAFIELATVHYDLDLDVMLQNSNFDFLHDFAQIPQHFDYKTGTFDNHFLPRAVKINL